MSTANVDAPRLRPGTPDPLPGSIPAFTIDSSDIQLVRLAQPDTYLDKTGRRFALLRTESGRFEAWAWPLKLFTGFRLSFFVSKSTTPIAARDIVHRIDVRPEATTITYVYQSFVVRMHVVVSIDDPGAILLLDVDTDDPLTIVAGFIPTMQPMWPAGLGGQYAFWDDSLHAYVISESSRRNHAFVGSAAGAGMSYTPAHMLGEEPNEFRIDVSDPASVRGRFIPIVMAGGKGERAAVREVYSKLEADPKSVYTRARSHHASVLAGTTSITTPEPTLDLALEWAKTSYDNLFASNPDFEGTGLMAGLDRAGSGGRPGFGWFFGGDTYINTLSLNALGMFDASRTALAFMTQFQRNDGKMAHEVTQARKYVDWFGDYPYAYIHADTSPWYIAAVHDHYAATGNRPFLESEWSFVRRAYDWCLTTDIDGDGLMDNEAAGLGALEFGAMTEIQTDVYLGAVWTRALKVLSELAREMGDLELAEEAASRYGKAASAFEKFWSDETSQYAYGFNADGTTVGETTPWPSVGMMFGYGTPERRQATMDRLSHSDMTTDWGIRMLSTNSDLFEPLNYNYGAVWPFVTSWVSTAHFQTGRPLQGYSSLMSTVQHVYNRSLGDIQEVISGIRHTWPAESVPHQGFAIASTVLPTVRGLFGLFYDAPSNTLTFGPQVPDDWDRYSVKRFLYGDAQIDIGVARSGGTDIYNFTPTSPTTLVFRPLLPPGTSVESVRSGNREIDFSTSNEPGGVRIEMSIDLDGPLKIEIVHSNEPMIIPPVWQSPVGSESSGLRVLSYERDGPAIDVEVEGRPGQVYHLGITEAERVAAVEGAERTVNGVAIRLPDGDATHTTHRVRIRITEPGGGR
jgi:glycogen debranching enzyme